MIKHVFLLLALISTDPREIAKINTLKKDAARSFTAGNYEKAINKYQILDSLGVEDPALKLNLAHAYYQLNDTTGALTNYQAVLNAPSKKLRSVAYQQLGVMKKESKKYEEALQYLKSSLKADPTNEGARYDYELVKKLLEEQKKQEQQDQQNQDQQNQDQEKDQENKEDQQKGDQEKEQQEQDGEKEESDEKQDGEKKEGENEEGEEQEGEEEPSQEEMMQQKLEEMKISPEKAKMILEAMRNNEVQYLQQQRRKPTKRPPSGKPDW